MSTNKVTVSGGHTLSLFTKTETTHSGQATYSIPVKESIAGQYYTLVRDVNYHQTKAAATLAKVHDVAKGTIIKWVKLHGKTIVTPTPKLNPDRKSIKINDENTSLNKGVSEELVQTLLQQPSLPAILEKLTELCKVLPSVDITISIRNPE